jgi:hypothetical protein
MMNMYKLTGLVALTAILSGEIKAQTYTWSPAGPVLSAGRSRNMVIDRVNPNVLYVGSVSSGIFTSTNAAASWVPVNDQDIVRNISYLAQGIDNTLYASTGEGFLRTTAKSRAVVGSGLYKLNGTTLQQLADTSKTGAVITRIACDPTNANNIALAGSKGLKISNDKGVTFNLAGGAVPVTATALTVYYDTQGNLYATASASMSSGGFTYNRVYKSTGGSLNGFVDITPPQSLLPDQNFGRIELGISKTNPNVIYASVAKPTPLANTSAAGLYGFYVSKDGGTTWTLILEGSPQLDPLSNGGSTNSGDYAHCVTVNPLNEDQVFIGSYQFYSWTHTPSAAADQGTWNKLANTFSFLRPNVHDIKITTSGSSLSAFYFVTDAGVYKSTDFSFAGDVWTNYQPYFQFQLFSNGLGTAQYNSVDITRYPKTTKTAVGTQTTLAPYSGFIAATAGNGVSYFNGNYPSVTSELNYLNDDYFNATYSKLSPNTAFFAAANSNLYVSPDITAGDPTPLIVSHLGSQCATGVDITVMDFRGISNGNSTTDQTYANNQFNTTGTPYKLWENYNTSAVDSAIFFNDSVRVLIPLTTTVGTTTSYTVSLIKPQSSAILDKVNISTFTVQIASLSASSCFSQSTTSYTTNTKATMEFAGATTPTAAPTGYTLTGLTSTVINTLNKVAIDATDPLGVKDVIQFELPVNPLAPIASSSANLQFVRVGVTVFYRYPAGSKIIIDNANISNLPFKDSLVFSAPVAWTFTNVGTNSLAPVSTDAPIKFKMKNNSRLAIMNDKAVMISKRPLNTNDPQKFQPVSCSGALTANSTTWTAGTLTMTGLPSVLEWAPNGKALYFVTATLNPSPTYKVYKVNVRASMYDFSIEDYRGTYYTGVVYGKRTGSVFTYTNNPRSPYRTSLLGTFTVPITNMAVSDDSKTLLLTTKNDTTKVLVSTPNIDLDLVDNTNVIFSDKSGIGSGLPSGPVYCALFEKSDNKRVLVGTDRGVYVTNDITAASPTWSDAKNNLLPNVQIFDIKQQKMSSWDSYNSGIIYVATNGRGAWMNKNYMTQTVIGVEEHENIAKNTGLRVFPNPTNGNATVSFFAVDNEDVVVNVIDINGRVLKSEKNNNLTYGYTDYTFNTNDLSNGVYIVNIQSSKGISRVTKLIVAK